MVVRYLATVASWKVPHYTRLGLYSQAIIVIVCLFYFQLWPLIPTTAIGFLGFLAVVVAVRAVTPEHFSWGERIVYILIAFALFAVEMRAIYKDRDEHDREQAAIRTSEDDARRKETDAFAELIKEGRGLLSSVKEIDALAKKSLEDITGGKSFAIITPQVWTAETTIPLSIRNFGEQTLTGVEVTIYGEQENPDKYFVDPIVIKVGTLHGGAMRLLKETIVPRDGHRNSYQLHISAQNFTVVEYLTFRRGKKLPWDFSYQVTRQFVKSRTKKETKFGYEVMATSNWREP
jgi:hypothetical protein